MHGYILYELQSYNTSLSNAERQALEEMNDPHLIVLTMFDALLKSMQMFETNIDLKNGGDAELKSKHLRGFDDYLCPAILSRF